MKTSLARGSLALAIAAAIGCSKTPEPEPAPVDSHAAEAKPSAPVATATATTAAAAASSSASKSAPSDVTWEVPSGWKTLPNTSPMRKATYGVPKASGDRGDTELAVSAAGGGVAPNVDRWKRQFGGAEAKTEARTVNGLKVTVVEMKGPYAGMGAAAPTPNQMLLGAIVDLGERQEFFKMIGPEKSVTAAKPAFEKLVSSLRAK
jgi:hypothetical protein